MSVPSMTRIITRKSQLAMWQASWVKKQLIKHYPDLTVKIIGTDSLGDIDRSRPTNEIGGKGVFVKSLQQALLDHKADIAVHCVKDMSAHPTPDLSLISIPEREDVRDALISKNNLPLAKLPAGAVIGTGSPRRSSFLKAYRPDLIISPIRGNIDSRLNKLRQAHYDAIILACAGLRRLNQENLITETLDPHWFIPSIGQGALGIECRTNDTATQELILPLNHKPSFNCVTAERAVNQILKGDCHSPISAWASYQANSLSVKAQINSLDGQISIKCEKTSDQLSPQKLGEQVAHDLLSQGAEKLLY